MSDSLGCSMHQRDGRTGANVAVACVGLLRELEEEIRLAQSAITCNKLADLEESLWRQETLCAKLKRSISSPHFRLLEVTSRNSLREAFSTLNTQVQMYEKVVTQSRRTTAILQHLCSLYRNAAQHPGRAIYKSLSREA
jgi:Zn-dependent oligopeptidase